MAGGLFNSGCCCGTCAIGSDTFPTDGSGVPTGWTLRTGGFDVAGGFLSCTTSNSMALFSTPHPDGIASAIVTVEVYFAGAEQETIVFDHSGSDDNNFYFVRIELYLLSLWRMNAGTPELLRCIRADNTAGPATITAYFDGQTSGMFAASNGTVSVWTDVGTGHTGTYVGLGTRTIDSQADFDTFTFAKYKQSGNSCDEFVPPDCELAEDNFNSADDTDPGCPWDELAGTGGIVSNKYVFTATNSRSRFTPGSADGAMSVSVKFQGTTAGNTIEVGVGSDTTASAMWYARLAIGLNKDLLIGSIAGGTLASIAGTIDTTIDTEYTITVTLANGRLCASLTDDNGAQYVTTLVTVPTTLKYATLGTRTVVSGSVKFDDFILSRSFDEDTRQSCATCDATGPNCYSDCCPEAATEMHVTVAAGLTNKTNCTWCAALVGTFVADYVSGCIFRYCSCPGADNHDCDETCDDGTDGPCGTGDSTGTGPCGAGIHISVEIKVDGSNLCYLRANVGVNRSTLATGYALAFARYESAHGISPCSGQTYTLSIVTTPTDCGSGIIAPYTDGCNGSFPATITVQAAP